MSRIGKMPVSVPAGVEVAVSAAEVSVKGPLGTLKQPLSPHLRVKREANQVVVEAGDESIQADAMSGTLVGVGYRAQAQGDKLNLSLGFSHPVVHQMPKGVKVETPTQTEILIKGIDKQQVGQVAAEVRAYRPPEPYKGKGVRYADEVVILKETKKK
jgi:large subunit ribosomal protein L6